jgi:hypothetical protein
MSPKNSTVTEIGSRAARVRAHGGVFGSACAALEGARDRAYRAEHETLVLLRRMMRWPLRLFFELLIVVVIALFELDTLRRHAASALVTRRR